MVSIRCTTDTEASYKAAARAFVDSSADFSPVLVEAPAWWSVLQPLQNKNDFELTLSNKPHWHVFMYIYICVQGG